MNKKILNKIDNFDRHQLRSFVLERRDVGEYDKLEQQVYALDRLIEMAIDEGKKLGKREYSKMF